jgi:heme exporter protein A
MISVDSVSKRFGRVLALDRVEMSVESGETLAVFGSNGAGKTTLLRLIVGLLRPTDGTVLVRGLEPVKARAAIGYLGADPLLYPSLTALENLRFFASLYDLDPVRADQRIEDVGLRPKKDSLVRALSQGETRRIAIARALLHDPDYLIIDEPFAGLDDESASAFGPLIEREGRTTVIATHDIDRGKAIADRTITLETGRLL